MTFDSRVSSRYPKQDDDDRVDVEVKRLVELYGLPACRRSLDKLSIQERQEVEVEARSTAIHATEQQQQGGVKQRADEGSRGIHVVDHKPQAASVGAASVLVGEAFSAVAGLVASGLAAAREDEEEEDVRGTCRIPEEQEASTRSTIQEVVHRKQQQQQEEKGIQEHDNALITALLDASPDAIFAVCPASGTILSVNHAGIKMFGYDGANDGDGSNRESELIGQKIETVLGVGRGAGKGEEGVQNGAFLEFFGAEHSVPEQPTPMNGTASGAAAPPAQRCRVGRRHQREVVCRRRDGSQFPAVVGVQRVEPSFLFAFVRDTSEERRARELEVSARTADELLRNLLPDEIIDRLKADPSHLADQHENAPVLFADIVGFTAMSSKMKPLELVRVLNDLFTRFDGLVEDYGLNKVKTIGDCYMVTSIPRQSDPVKACRAMCYFALDMLQALQEFNTEQQGNDSIIEEREQKHQPLGLRVGINCGTVVAGVVGTKRFMYDLWGDAVNVASRMESTGIPLRIQVTKAVVDQVPEGEFEFRARGEIHVKGKGTMETFFLEKGSRNGNGDLFRQSPKESYEPASPSSLSKNTKKRRRRASEPRDLATLLLGLRLGPSELSVSVAATAPFRTLFEEAVAQWLESGP